MKLYYFETPNPRRACAVARYLNSPVEFVRVDLGAGQNRTPDFLAINPNGKVPALADGEAKLWESNAIMAYLARKAGSDLFPNDDRQIEILRWLSWDLAHFSRHGGTLLFEHFIKGRFGMGEPDPERVEEATGFFKRFAAVLNDHLKGRDTLVGDGLTIADFAVACMLPSADLAKLPLEGCLEIDRWHGKLMELPAWREPFPTNVAQSA
ncbi:MAG: glutathione S-transferase family protein [Pseudomonadota bacterium]